MNDVQKKLRGLLACFTQICNQLELPYYLLCGSALGAVKYGGFIPWDDDVDVGMLRADYETFCARAPALLPDHLFLQNYRSDPCFPAVYAKLRDSGTTCVEASVAKLPMNHGIALDIFPLDGYPDDRASRLLLEVKKRIFIRLLSVPCERPERWKEQIVRLVRPLVPLRRIPSIAERYTRCISRWSPEKTALIANHGNWQGKLDYHRSSVFGSGQAARFEGLQVRIPADAEGYLRRKYGDYRQDPPLQLQKSHHQFLYLDPELPFMAYLSGNTPRSISDDREKEC